MKPRFYETKFGEIHTECFSVVLNKNYEFNPILTAVLEFNQEVNEDPNAAKRARVVEQFLNNFNPETADPQKSFVISAQEAKYAADKLDDGTMLGEELKSKLQGSLNLVHPIAQGLHDNLLTSDAYEGIEYDLIPYERQSSQIQRQLAAAALQNVNTF